MAYFGRDFAVLALAGTASLATALVGCNDNDAAIAAFTANQQRIASTNDPSAAGTVSACDGIRRHIRQDAIKDFGFDHMLDQIKRIAREISTEEREDLKRFVQAVDAPGLNPDLRLQSMQMIQNIYNHAVDQSGIRRGVGEAHEDIHRTIFASPAGSAPLFDGYTVVMSSSPTTSERPAEGQITDAFLGVNADQSRFELLLIKVKTVTPSANNGVSTTGDYITMSQYVESKLPTYCQHVGSALPPAQLNFAE